MSKLAEVPTARIGFWAVLLLAASLCFFHLGAKPFWDYDEAIYASVIHDTQASGDLLTLSSGRSPWYEKPPLYFWASMEVQEVIPHPEFAYRFTSALLGVVSIALVMLIALEAGASLAAAVAAGAILLCTGPFIEAARQVRLDVPVIACILAAAYCFLRGRRSPRWYLGVGVFIGVGVLTKSVIALLVGPFILSWALVHGDWQWLRNRYIWLGALVGLVVLAPWHIYESFAQGMAFWDSYLLHHILARFAENIIGTNLTSLDYLKFLFEYAAPWSWLFVAVLIAVASSTLRKDIWSLPPPLLAFGLTTLAVFAVFFAASTKIDYYLLPAYPFIALTLAFAGEWVYARAASSTAKRVFYGAGAVFLLAGAAMTIYFGFHFADIMRINDLISANEEQAGMRIAQHGALPVYTYQYDYWDTIKYYSGHSDISKLDLNQGVSGQFFLVASTPYMSAHEFGAAIAPHFQKLYEGRVLTLYIFNP